MGTNYYHRTNICGPTGHLWWKRPGCGRYDATHICKSMTSFAAVVEWLDEPPYGDRIVCGTWAEWKDRLRAGGEVWNEYGERIPTEEFIAQVETVAPEARRRQYDWCVTNGPTSFLDIPISDGPRLGAEWLDEDGFSFSGRAFS